VNFGPGEEVPHLSITGTSGTAAVGRTSVNFGPGEEVPHLGSDAAHRRATSITGISGTVAVGGASIGKRFGKGPGVERSSGPCAKGK